jgi:hypothetical protein
MYIVESWNTQMSKNKKTKLLSSCHLGSITVNTLLSLLFMHINVLITVRSYRPLQWEPQPFPANMSSSCACRVHIQVSSCPQVSFKLCVVKNSVRPLAGCIQVSLGPASPCVMTITWKDWTSCFAKWFTVRICLRGSLLLSLFLCLLHFR